MSSKPISLTECEQELIRKTDLIIRKFGGLARFYESLDAPVVKSLADDECTRAAEEYAKEEIATLEAENAELRERVADFERGRPFIGGTEHQLNLLSAQLERAKSELEQVKVERDETRKFNVNNVRTLEAAISSERKARETAERERDELMTGIVKTAHELGIRPETLSGIMAAYHHQVKETAHMAPLVEANQQLREYITHKHDCPVFRYGAMDHRCTCGLHELLTRYAATKEPQP